MLIFHISRKIDNISEWLRLKKKKNSSKNLLIVLYIKANIFLNSLATEGVISWTFYHNSHLTICW